MLFEGGILPRVLPAVAQSLDPSDDPVHGRYPLAGVGVADGVEERLDLAVEDGPCDELALFLALDEVPVGVDQDNAFMGLRHDDPA